jgi:hypothetical protein
MQTTSHLLMIRPYQFGYNPETAINNAFQVKSNDSEVQDKAAKEFDDFVSLLQKNGVDITVVQDTPEPHTPDSIFPNNWVSFHANGMVVLYPMFAINRRRERNPDVLQAIGKKFTIGDTIDLSYYEKENIFLEGTGSMVLDRDKKIAYACLSQRTDKKILDEFCSKMNYTAEVFFAADQNGLAIYHTNVMMCVADKYIVICLDAIPDPAERNHVKATIDKSGKELITITLDQMNHFAGNMLQVENNLGEKLLVMSSQAFESLTKEQINKLASINRIIHSPLSTIETNGGGSARCMMAEIHLPLL